MASPPLLVMLGLTLPDSRILSGIASIGLTLANIAIILPHLRQPIIDSMRAFESALAGEQGKIEQLAPDETRPVILHTKSPFPVSLSAEHQSPPLNSHATVESVCSTYVESLGCQDVVPEAAPQTPPLPSAAKADDGQTPSPSLTHPFMGADSNEVHISSSCLFAREGRGAIYIPLPVPDVEEIAFFDTEDATSSNYDLQGEFHVVSCEQHALMEDRGGKNMEQDDQLADLSSRLQRVEMAGNSTGATMHAKMSPSTSVTIPDHRSSSAGTVDLLRNLSGHGAVAHRAQTKSSYVSGKEALTKCRPESLEFIPQSVLRRYSLVPTVSAGDCFEPRVFSSGQEYQFSPRTLANPTIRLEGAKPRATYTTLEGLWHSSLFTEDYPTRQLIGGPTFIIGTVPVKDPLEQESSHEPTPLRQYSTRQRRLGVLARAALRDRRARARRRKNDENDGFSSDSDSGFDSDSQSSSGSSANESIFPHMLGADLIAAIDANSESDLNLAMSRRTKRAPLNLYEEFLVSEYSSAEASMAMQVSSNDDASDGELTAPASRSLNYEDIQQWASGVVQKCVRQVRRSIAPVEPSSPSQASDVCAERPSGSGVSQCPLSGLHCKLGAAMLTDLSPPRTKEPPVSRPTISVAQGRKPLQVRNLRDIPEFVPRQRHITTAGRVDGLGTCGARSTINIARDAAAQVIARMEGTEKRMVNTAAGRQGMLRCA